MVRVPDFALVQPMGNPEEFFLGEGQLGTFCGIVVVEGAAATGVVIGTAATALTRQGLNFINRLVHIPTDAVA
jgi:putative N-acetylmannosamine-6-phosphate epimerase